MADKKKKATTSTKKKTGSANSVKSKGRTQTKQTKQTKKKPADFGEFHEEIVVILSIVVMIFLMLSNFSLCGTFGNLLSGMLFGVFGAIQYILPIMSFLAITLLISNRFSSLAIKKVLLGGASVLSICTLSQLMLGISLSSAKNAYRYSAIKHTGGGYVGEFIRSILETYLGTVGAYLITIACLLISLVLITEHSFLAVVKKGGGKVANTVRIQGQAAKKNLDEIREQRKLQAKEKRTARALFDEEQRKRLIKDPDLHKKTMVLPEDAVFVEESAIPRKRNKKSFVKDILELHYDGEGTNFELDKMAKEEKEKEEKEPTVHLLYEEDVPAQKDVQKESVQTQPSGWNLDLNDLPTEEEQLQGSKTAKEVILPSKDTIPVKRAQKVSFPETKQQLEHKEEGSTQVLEEENGYALKRAVSVQQEQDKKEMSKTMQVVQQMMQPKESSYQSMMSRREEEIPKKETPIIEQKKEVIEQKEYQIPPFDLLKRGQKTNQGDGEAELLETAKKLQQTLENFGVRVTVTDVSQGPSVTRYELQPEQGVKVSKIVGLADDIKLNLAASDIRIEAPIPGKAAVGIEVPNKTNAIVMFRDLIENETFTKFPSDLAFAVGKDIGGKTIVTDIAKMPHLLIAGATGSGKSVCINTLIMSILYKAKPSDVKLIMIDPKVVELSTYNGIPHLLIPVVTDPKKASSALNWAVMEMTERYKKFAEVNVRNLKGYNAKVEEVLSKDDTSEQSDLQKLPQIVIIVDELADLMMVAPGEVEDAIVRLSQLARAAGIHLVIATQRPSVNVITGLIKANVPSRIAFSVSSGVDSRTILDMNGAEKLLGKGDMLFYPSGYQKPVRVQGAFISDDEVTNVVEFLKEQSKDGETSSLEVEEKINNAVFGGTSNSSELDEYFVDAAKFIIEKEKASIGMLQRMFRIGFNRAARIMEQLSDAGVVGPEEGTKPRKVIMSMEELEQYIEEYL